MTLQRMFLHLAAAGLALQFSLAPAVAADLAKAAPSDAGFSAERLDRIEGALKPYIADKQLAGAVVGVARHGKLVYLKSFGSADAESGTPMKDDAIFRIASMTKAITSVAVMMLQEDGKLLVKDPVSKYIPEFKEPKVMVPRDAKDAKAGYDTVPANREVTIRDLLAHTSGITYRFWGNPAAAVYEEGGVPDGLSPNGGEVCDAVRKLARLPLLHQPGSVYEYGLNTDVLGCLVEVVSGMPLDRFMKDRIFTPLGMKDTQFYISPAQRSRVASLYIPDGKGAMMRASDEPIRWGTLMFAANLPYQEQRTYFSGGAGLTSTAMDYLRFMQMLLNGGILDGNRVLGPKSVELMRTNAIGSISLWDRLDPAATGNLGDKFGLGFGIRSERGLTELGSVGEFMWAGIYNTRYWMDPKEDLAIVFMSQRIPRLPDIEEKVHAAVYQAIVK
ncbi:MAG: beta-lactamase family protein [Burkholderiales bacterium]|nr:beta-lactamase family protein [Burkholderiales bacterium]